MSKTKKPVEFSTRGAVAGIILSTLKTLVSEMGGTYADFYRLATPEGADDLEAIAAIIVGSTKAVAGLIPERWTVVELMAPSRFDVSKLKPVPLLKQGESPIGGEEMRKRAVELKGNLGLVDVKRMLAERDKIPAEFRKFCIPLPGTVLDDSSGALIVPCLDFLHGRWVLRFYWLARDWDNGARFACCE